MRFSEQRQACRRRWQDGTAIDCGSPRSARQCTWESDILRYYASLSQVLDRFVAKQGIHYVLLDDFNAQTGRKKMVSAQIGSAGSEEEKRNGRYS